MKYFSSDIIFPISSPPVKEGVVVTDDHGKILDLLDPEKHEMPDASKVARLIGFICPGFVNAHCHLELSHLKGKFSEKEGLPFFIGQMVELRNKDEEKVMQAMLDADEEMHRNGIVAIGDISNISVSSIIKKQSRIHYHTFIELFDIFPERAEVVFKNGLELSAGFRKEGLGSSIVPHAPYTVTNILMELIAGYAASSKGILCIHNQETSSENEMFETGTGTLLDKLNKMTGAFGDWKASGLSSVRSIINNFPKEVPLQLVHNTFSRSKDVHASSAAHPNLFWCLCPNANLYIENCLPDIMMLTKENCKMTVGTDSYASNYSLSIWDEIRTINKNYPEIEISDLLKWSTLNGAEFLGIDKRFGSIERSKTPGLILITGVDDVNMTLANSAIRRLV